MGNPTPRPEIAVDVTTVVGNTAVAVTPSDSTVVDFVAFYVGVGGDVAIKSPDNSTAVTFVGVPQGSIIPVRCNRIMSTNTTATSIVGLKY